MYDGAFYAEGKGVIAATDGSGEMAAELGRGIVESVDKTRCNFNLTCIIIVTITFLPHDNAKVRYLNE